MNCKYQRGCCLNPFMHQFSFNIWDDSHGRLCCWDSESWILGIGSWVCSEAYFLGIWQSRSCFNFQWLYSEFLTRSRRSRTFEGSSPTLFSVHDTTYISPPFETRSKNQIFQIHNPIIRTGYYITLQSFRIWRVWSQKRQEQEPTNLGLQQEQEPKWQEPKRLSWSVDPIILLRFQSL